MSKQPQNRSTEAHAVVNEFYSKDEDRVPTNISYDMAEEIMRLREENRKLKIHK